MCPACRISLRHRRTATYDPWQDRHGSAARHLRHPRSRARADHAGIIGRHAHYTVATSPIALSARGLVQSGFNEVAPQRPAERRPSPATSQKPCMGLFVSRGISPSSAPLKSRFPGRRRRSCFFVRPRTVSLSRPERYRAPGAVAVSTGRRPPPEAARSGVDWHEHGANLRPVGNITAAMVPSVSPQPTENEPRGACRGRVVSRRNLVCGWVHIGPGP